MMNCSKSVESDFRVALYVNFTAGESSDEQQERIDFIRKIGNYDFIIEYDERKEGSVFREMISDAKSGEFDFIITPSVRTFNSDIKETLRITRELKDYGVAVWFVDNDICTLSLADELVLQLASRLPSGSREANRLLRNEC